MCQMVRPGQACAAILSGPDRVTAKPESTGMAVSLSTIVVEVRSFTFDSAAA